MAIIFSGGIKPISGSFSVRDGTPIYNLTGPSVKNEGTTATYQVDLVNVQSTTLYWTIDGTTADFTAVSGSVVVSNYAGSFNISIIADAFTEGTENYTVSLRKDSISGEVVATAGLEVSDSSITPPNGQAEYTSAGTYVWTAPAGVTSVCAVCIGGGGGGIHYNSTLPSTLSLGGGGGGGLGWKNNIAVVPGQSYTVRVGAAGQGGAYQASGAPAPTNGAISYFINTGIVYGNGGGAGKYAAGSSGGNYLGDGGGLGGSSGFSDITGYGPQAGCGAGGYSGEGGGAYSNRNPRPAAGGAGGPGIMSGNNYSGGGGGTGIYGEGASGSLSGGGGSGGGGGAYGYSNKNGGWPGGGGGGSAGNTEYGPSGNGAHGAVRLVWGNNRAFPSTNTGNV